MVYRWYIRVFQLLVNANVIYTTTAAFLDFFDKKWKCEKNRGVRSHAVSAGYQLKTLAGKSQDSPPYLVKPTVYKDQSHSVWFGYIQISDDKNCALESTFAYLDCKSNWNSVNQSDLGFTDKFQNTWFALFANSKYWFDQYNPKIYGYVIKLNIKCRQKSYYVVMKVNGTQRCSTTPKVASTTTAPTTATMITTTTASDTTTTTKATTMAATVETKQTSTTFSATQSPKFDDLSTTLPASKQPLSKGGITKLPLATQSSKYDNTTEIPNKQDRKSSGTTDNSGMIAGAIGGVVALVTIVVILFVIWMKRKRNLQSKRVTTDRADNAAYDGAGDRTLEITGQLQLTDDEYSYAYSNNQPIVIKDQNGKALKVPGDSNRQNGKTKAAQDYPPKYDAQTLEDPDYAKLAKTQDVHNGPSYNVLHRPENKWKTKQGPVYDVLEDPNSAVNVNSTQNHEGPLYNTLEDPDYAKLEKENHTHSEPSYNVLVSPECNWTTKQGPVYDVLEGPDSDGAPVYDVLEGPESDEQHVYGSLEGQDHHLYGALNSPTSMSGVVCSGYDDVLYDSADDVIQSGDIYQELNQASRLSSDDVYQPLRHPRKSTAMKDMSGVTQSHA